MIPPILNKILLIGILSFYPAGWAMAAESAPLYLLPPDPIPRILDTPPTPSVSLSPDRRNFILMEREGLLPISRLAEPELRLAGVRLNPRTNGPARAFFGTALTLVSMETGARHGIPLPMDVRISHLTWSPDGARLAFAHTGDAGIELWVWEQDSGEARRAFGPGLNAVLGRPFVWDADGRSLYLRRVPADRGEPPAAPRVPSGPQVMETSGRAAPVRTYQDLLANPHDEALFEHYFSSEWARLELRTGRLEAVLPTGIWSGLGVSPDGQYLLATRHKRPYSHLAPLFAFAREIVVVDRDGNLVHRVEDRSEVTLPRIGRDMVNPGPRFVQWRADAPATLVWADVLDGGDARQPSKARDRVFQWAAPFSDGDPTVLIDLDQRLAGISWGRDDVALVRSLWRTTSRTKTHLVNPGNPGEARLIFDLSSEDRYSHPGNPMTEPTGNGHRVLHFDPTGKTVFLAGEGASPTGAHPFLDEMDLATGETTRLWQSSDPHHESVTVLLSRDGQRFLTRRESADEPPNYFIRDLHSGGWRQITDFPDPAPELAGIQRRIITYEREDGIPLNATLITPPGHEVERDGPLPMLFWAYPREYRDAASAGQVTDSPHRFHRPRGASHLFLLTQGYAILDGPAMPIIGEGEKEPNDTYVEQLVASAAAAVDAVVKKGIARRDRIGVGGHSYGAFMAANLLAHSDLFQAGIARSGAYNRTLTPFGFQAEPRSFWEAPEVYSRMSPFNHADRIRHPILFLHGEADNNSGTFPMQSERMYHAVKGNGGTARLVMLPHESHGYAARESVLHVLAEMIAWMDLHVKKSPD